MESNVFETANAGFAQAMYEEFLRDPAAVGSEWRRLFESGVVGVHPDTNGSAPVTPRPAVTAALQPASATPAPASPPTGASPIKGPAAKLVANMNESLTVPTATTLRVLPVGVLEQKRRMLNQGLQTAGRPGKISFTHLIAFALVQATKQHPVMGHTLVVREGTPYRVAPEGIALGLAVDVQRKDGSRGLVVPVIKRADTMDFAAFHTAYEGLVDQARSNRLMPDDFAGATMSLTNPGGLGTVASVPRLMAGQGSIIAVGAIGYPAEFSGAAEERLREFGISKVMTVTSTYDHRVIQGAESGAFLATVDHLLQGEQGFFELIAESLGLGEAGYQLARPSPAAKPGQELAGPIAPDMLYHVAAAMALVKAFRMHGHLAAHL
ncbi:MAG TPA: 2-oxo acid dehydrogenase subunit E2, partial [Gemmatimonadales bacterium]|nr:2-oxo acid dehydrogenase subunit E2 [Gemmatimonadales bacterium]